MYTYVPCICRILKIFNSNHKPFIHFKVRYFILLKLRLPSFFDYPISFNPVSYHQIKDGSSGDCFRRSVVKIHFLSRNEICKNIQGQGFKIFTKTQIFVGMYVTFSYLLCMSNCCFLVRFQDKICMYLLLCCPDFRLRLSKNKQQNNKAIPFFSGKTNFTLRKKRKIKRRF